MWTDRIRNACGRKRKLVPHAEADVCPALGIMQVLDRSLLCQFLSRGEKDGVGCGTLYPQAKLRNGEACPSLCTERHPGHEKLWFRGGRGGGGLCRMGLGPQILLCSLKHSYSVSHTKAGFPWS